MKTIVLDFDYTLFNAKKFRRALANSQRPFGVDTDLFEKTYKEIRYQDGKERDYLPNEHLKILAKKSSNNFGDLKNAFDKVIDNCAKFLYPDSLDFLKKQKNNSHKLILLTFGNPEFQKRKIKACEIEKYFSEILYTDKAKTSLTHKIPDTKEVIFINDNPKEIMELKKNFKKAKFIQIQRTDGKKYSHNHTFIKITNLDQFL